MENLDDFMSEDFLDLVWGSTKGWVDLPAKVGKYWVPWHHKWTGEAGTDISGRIDACLRDRESLYFSVGIFNQRGRNFDDLQPPQWLWADLDEIAPQSLATSGLLPTLAWESSPGRFQSLWRLNKRVSIDSFDKLNQALSYHAGADHGGWDRTQVLRLPGTRNYKYPTSPEVKMLWYQPELSYSAAYVWDVVRGSLPVGPSATGHGVSNAIPRAMPALARSLLRVPSDAVVEGERSSKLWQIECLLAEAGWGEDAIYAVVSESAWNKWSGVGTGERRLRYEIRKALSHVSRMKVLKRKEKDDKGRTSSPSSLDGSGERVVDRSGDGADAGDGDRYGDGDDDRELASAEDVLVLPWVRYDSFMAMAMEEPRWLIENLWTAGSHGILGGEPKTNKTTLALGLAVAVASGASFLGVPDYRVRTPGPVLLVQEENAPWMVQDRMRKLAWLSGLIPDGEVKFHRASRGSLGRETITLEFPSDIPLRLLNNHGLDLTYEDHREALWRECEMVKPRLVILDPLYLIYAGVNFNEAHALAPHLQWLLALRNEFDCAVIVVHHYKKQRQDSPSRGGQRLMGNATLHGFLDSALYTERMEDRKSNGKKGMYYTRVEREFRSMEPQSALEVGIKLGQPGDLEMKVEIGRWDLQRTIEDLVTEREGMTVNQLAEELGITRFVALGRCRDSSVLEVIEGRRGRGLSHRVVPQSNGHVE